MHELWLRFPGCLLSPGRPISSRHRESEALRNRTNLFQFAPGRTKGLRDGSQIRKSRSTLPPPRGGWHGRCLNALDRNHENNLRSPTIEYQPRPTDGSTDSVRNGAGGFACSMRFSTSRTSALALARHCARVKPYSSRAHLRRIVGLDNAEPGISLTFRRPGDPIGKEPGQRRRT